MKKLLIILLLIPIVLIAQISPTHIPEALSNTYINDSYGYINDGEKSEINKTLYNIEKTYGVQVAIILVPRIPEEYGIEDYAREIGRKWHVGHAKNGIVYVAAIDEHLQRLEIASHLEGTIPDITAKRLTESVKPYFRSQKYGEGILQLVNGISTNLQPAKVEQNKLVADEKKKKEAGDIGTIIFICLLLCVGGGCAIFFLIKRRKRLLMEQARIAEINDIRSYQSVGRLNRNSQKSDITIVPIIPDSGIDYSSEKNNHYSSGTSSNDYGSSSSSSDYGNWGSGSSDSGSTSSDSGFSGGGSTDNW